MFPRRKRHEGQAASAAARQLWTQVADELDALAAAPASPDRLAVVAARCAHLALTPPAGPTLTGRAPLGFALRPGGVLVQDCALTQRALGILGGLIDAGHDPVRHLQLRANLLLGWERYHEASDDLERASQLITASSPEAMRARGVLHHHAAMARAQAATLPPLPEHEQDQLQALIAQLAGQVARVVPFTAPRVTLYAPGEAPLTPDERLIALDAQLAAQGLRLLAWVENSWFAELFGQRVLTGAWGTPDGALVVSAGAVGAVEVADVESWCADGRFVTTTASRGRSPFEGGPWVDALAVDPAVPIDEVLTLHRARLRALLATTPGLQLQAVPDAPRWVQMQEAMRLAKAEFRLAEGLSETEALGMGLPHPALTTGLLRAAAREAVAAAHAAATHAAAA